MTEKIYYCCRTLKNVILPAQTFFTRFFLSPAQVEAHKNVNRKGNFVFRFFCFSFVVISIVKCIQTFNSLPRKRGKNAENCRGRKHLFRRIIIEKIPLNFHADWMRRTSHILNSKLSRSRQRKVKVPEKPSANILRYLLWSLTIEFALEEHLIKSHIKNFLIKLMFWETFHNWAAEWLKG